MSIIRKFKDFFGPTIQKKESAADRNNRIYKEIVDRLNYIKEEISDIFRDFEDLGASVEILPVYKNYLNGEIDSQHGNIRIEIKFPQKNIENIDKSFKGEIRRCLVEAKFRMDDIPGAEVDKADYRSNWSKRDYFSYTTQPNMIKRSDVIYMPKWGNETPETSLKDKNAYIVKLWSADDTRASKEISKLNSLVINIYTKPIFGDKNPKL